MKKGLGKGLGALIVEPVNESNTQTDNAVMEVDINKVEPNKDQPRRVFDEMSILELAHSIQEFGIIQPLIVTKKDDYFELVAGERRWRAARILKLKTVPVIIKDYSELETLEVSLIENIQREDLNPLEEALTYKRLSEEYKLNQEEIAAKVGKSRAAVANAMRLLNLDKRVQNFLSDGKVTTGHARALLSLDNCDMQFDVSEKIIEEELSVRETEDLLKKIILSTITDTNADKKTKDNQSPNTNRFAFIENDLKTIFGTKVSIKNTRNKDKGKIEIEYYSNEELDRLIGMFKTNLKGV